MKPKLTRGHSVSFQVTVSGRSREAAIDQAMKEMDGAGVPLDAIWKMEFHRGQERTNGERFREADYITVDATWAEQT